MTERILISLKPIQDDSTNMVTPTLVPVPTLTKEDRTKLRDFVGCQRNYRQWDSDLAQQFRNIVYQYMDTVNKSNDPYPKSKDGTYDYARWLITRRIPSHAKPRSSVKWLQKHYTIIT